LLLDRGADLNAVTNKNKSSLLKTARGGHADVMRVLISAGADVQSQVRPIGVPLYYTTRLLNSIHVLEVLLENVNVDTVDMSGNTLLHEAVHLKELRAAQLLVQHGAKVNAQNNYGTTPLHMAIKLHQYDMIMFLLSQDADVGLTDAYRNTPLHYVNSELLKYDAFADYITKKLTLKFQNPVTRNVFGVSAIQHSIAHGLLDNHCHGIKCSTMYVDCYGNTPLHHAVGVYAELDGWTSIGLGVTVFQQMYAY